MAGEQRFETHDLLVIGGIIGLGMAGHLSAHHSPIVQPFLPVFFAAFSAAIVVLGFLILRDAVLYRETGWLAGVMFVTWPVIFAILFYLGMWLVSIWL